MSLRNKMSSLLTTGLMVLLLSVAAMAQNNAAIEGTVTDATGGVISGAAVTVVNQATQVTATATTNDSGFYRVSQLVPGTYSVTIDAASFKKNISNDVVVQAETVRGLNISLAAGPVAETITVTAGVQGVETETANNEGTITTKELQEIPQPGRDPYELVRLTPGVFGEGARSGSGNAVFLPQQVGPGGSNSQIFQTENQIQAVSNGQRVSANNILLDGVSVNSLDWGGAAVVTPNQESVSAITVVASSYNAEDGRNSGIIVKSVSKSGANNLHGSGVIKFNDKGLNAFNRFAGPTTGTLKTITCENGTPSQFMVVAATCPERVDQKFRQFAGSLGGPILKDKLFFFFSYEGVRLSNSQLQRSVTLISPFFEKYIVATNPNSLAAKIFSTPGVQARIVNTIKEVNCCSLDGRPLGTWYQPGDTIGNSIGNGPLPTAGASTWGLYDLRIPNSEVGNQYNGRMDYTLGQNQFFFGTYYTLLDNLNGGRRPIEDVRLQPGNWTAALGWTRVISNTLLNDIRGNVTRYSYNQLNPTGSTNYGIPQIRIFDFDASGFGDAGRILGVPQSATTPASLAQNTFELRDTATWIHGQHAFKFGGDFIKEQNNNNEPGASRPDYQFRGILNLANDACCFFEGIAINPLTGGAADGSRHFRTSDYAFFGEDTWKLRPNLTLTAGLRWEYFTPLTETNNKLTNYIFGSKGFLNGSVQPVKQLYNSDRHSFAPKIGFAWAPTQYNGNFVVRGGFGINYNRDMGVAFSNVRQNTPFLAQVGACCFFDPGRIQGAPPGSNILYGLGSNNTAFGYPVNPAFANGVAPDGALCANKACTAIQTVDLFGALPNEPNPYVYSYSLEVQQAFTQRDVFKLGYYGSRSYKLLRTIDLNRFIPGDTFDGNQDKVQNKSANGVPCGPANPACPAPVQTGNPRFNRIFFALPDVHASYDALIANLTHRFAGLTVSGTYTWSHTIDTASFDIGAQQFDPSNQQLQKANSDFNVGNYFQLSGVWDLPFFRDRRDFLGQALGGWTVSTIASHHSGFPFSALIGSCDTNNDRNGDGFCPDLPFAYLGQGDPGAGATKQQFINGLFTNPKTQFDITTRGPGCRCRNIFTGPGYTDVDLTLAKAFGLPNMPVLGEGAKLELRANAFNTFNILNLSNFAPATAPTDIVNTGQFGRANTAYAGRVVEFQARFSF